MGDVTAIHPDRKQRQDLKERYKLLAGILAIYSIPVFAVLLFY